MLIFNEGDRKLTRVHALGFKSMEIAEDVNNMDEVEIVQDSENKRILLVKSNEQTDDPEYMFITERFGVLRDVPTMVEILLCDDKMLITLINGVLYVPHDDRYLLADRGVPASVLPKNEAEEQRLQREATVWVDLATILRNSECWTGMNRDYPYDYGYPMIIRGGFERDGAPMVSYKPVSKGQLYDFSDGKFAEMASRRAERKQQDLEREQQYFDDMLKGQPSEDELMAIQDFQDALNGNPFDDDTDEDDEENFDDIIW